MRGSEPSPKPLLISFGSTKSNAVYTAFNTAKTASEKILPDYDVPPHLRNAPTNLMKELGYGNL